MQGAKAMKRSPRCALLLVCALPFLAGCRFLLGPDSPERSDVVRFESPLPAAPGGDALEAAVFHIRARGASDQWVHVHRITAPWDEMTVTWNGFGASFETAALDSFLVDGEGWFEIDLRAVLPVWAAADEPFHGLLLRYDALATPRSVFDSREAVELERRPYLETLIHEADSLVARRFEVEADAFIWHAQPNTNYGDRNPLYAGWATPATNVQMQTLLRFPLPELPQDAVVGDRVWLDADADGLQDADEAGLAAVVVELRGAEDRELIDSVFSDAEGRFAFTAVAPGDYVLRVVPPHGFRPTLAGQGDDPLLDSDADEDSGTTPSFTLVAGQEDLSRDLGLRYAPVTHWEPRSVAFWRRHAGQHHHEDLITPLLPLWVGADAGEHSVEVVDAATAVDLLRQRYDPERCARRNTITRLRAQLLATKLNVAAGAEGAPLETLNAADAFLAATPASAWDSLDRATRRQVRAWKGALKRFNKGR